jgi:tRNA modification GTPase
MFRFIDTAGLRNTTDVIEQIGVNRALETIQKSTIVIYLFDAHELSCGDLKNELSAIRPQIGNSHLLIVANKTDTETTEDLQNEFRDFPDMIYISAKEQRNIAELKSQLIKIFDSQTFHITDTIVTNARHATALRNTAGALHKVMQGLEENVAGDLLALDIRYALDQLGLITGQVTSEDLLINIFSKFCIGK